MKLKRDVWLRSDTLVHAVVSSIPWMLTQKRNDDVVETCAKLGDSIALHIKHRQNRVHEIRSRNTISDNGEDEIFYLSESVVDSLREGRSL